jgi:hypothetical protein
VRLSGEISSRGHLIPLAFGDNFHSRNERTMQKRTLLAAISLALGSGTALANDFIISSPSTASQTLSANQTGTITASGSLTVSSGNAVAVNGNNATLTTLGTLSQTGTSRGVRDTATVTGLTINNGSTTNSTALIRTADADAIQMQNNSGILLNNYGTIDSLNASKGGAQAVDLAAITTASNVVNNFATGIIRARDADALRPGANGVVNNFGTIVSTVTTDTGSDGVDVQQGSGVTINNFGTGTITGARHGITGGPSTDAVAFLTTITNDSGGLIQGSNGSGINLDGFNANQTAKITNNGSIIGNGIAGDGDGVDVDGIALITNTGIIRSANAANDASEGVTLGGGSVTNSGLIEGLVSAGNTTATGRGITIAGIDITSGPNAGLRQGIYANTTVTNLAGGTIRGGSDSAIVVEGLANGFTVAIDNRANATIRGGGTTTAAIRTGANNDTITNAGLIDGSSSGRAIDMGAGNNTLIVSGGAASIVGDINGGTGGTNTMTIDPGAGNAFAYAGSISSFSAVNVQSGDVTLSGANTYTGATSVTGATLTLDGVNRLAGAGALMLSNGTLALLNAAGTNGQTFSSLSLDGHSTMDLNGSSLTFGGLGAVANGAELTVVDFYAATYAFRLTGDFSHDAAFLTLIDHTTIDGLAAAFVFDGTYTDVRAVPLPAGVYLLISGLGFLGSAVRRKRA